MTERPQDPTAFVFLNDVAIIEHLTRTAGERALSQRLSWPGFTVLNHMIRRGYERRAPAQIANAVQVTKGSMTGTLKRLQAEGWVAVVPDPKAGCGKVVTVKPAGRAIRETALEALTPFFASVQGAVSEAEIRAAIPVLQMVRPPSRRHVTSSSPRE